MGSSEPRPHAVPRGISPLRWGGCAWTFIHYVALGYPQNPTARDIDDYGSFFASLQYILPCKACRDHMREHVTSMPIDRALASGRDALFSWTIGVHNAVNASLGRPQVRAHDAFRRYMRSRISARSIEGRAIDMLTGAAGGVVVGVAFCALVRYCHVRQKTLKRR